jgi:hypothetical protein
VSGLRVIACASFHRDGRSELHDLARALRASDETALDAVVAIALAGLARDAPDVAASTDAMLVPMAGHLAGTVSGPAMRLTHRLCADHPGWAAASGPERVADAPAAIDAGPRGPAAEAATLRWPAVTGTGAVLLVDDVVHTGASLDAAWLAAPPGLRERLVALVAFRAED